MDQNMELLVLNIVGGTRALVGNIMVASRETSFKKLYKPKSGHFGRFVKMSDMSMYHCGMIVMRKQQCLKRNPP
jgi:hypothetical protein